MRAILDGHIVLSRQLGSAGHYPAIDVLNSVSRLTSAVASPQQRQAAQKVREALAAYHRAEDLINLGAYVAGSNPSLDAAISARPRLLEFLRQDATAKSPLDKTLGELNAVAGML